jgi:hypothetical protein
MNEQVTRPMPRIVVYRKIASHDYKVNPDANSFENNWKNNGIDEIRIMLGEEAVFRAACQTVANHPDYKYKDTVLEGDFGMQCFVDPRAFHGEIHGIVNAFDLEGQAIDKWSMQPSDSFQSGRWLVHDRYSKKANRDTNYAWSGGCFIMSTVNLAAFNEHLRALGVAKGTVLSGKLYEVKEIPA